MKVESYLFWQGKKKKVFDRNQYKKLVLLTISSASYLPTHSSTQIYMGSRKKWVLCDKTNWSRLSRSGSLIISENQTFPITAAFSTFFPPSDLYLCLQLYELLNTASECSSHISQPLTPLIPTLFFFPLMQDNANSAKHTPHFCVTSINSPDSLSVVTDL